MARPTLTINKQTPPLRCEICHQSDMFDAARGECQRCAPLAQGPAVARAIAAAPIAHTFASASERAITAAIFGIAAFIPGLCFAPVGLLFGIVSLLLGKRELTDIRRGRANAAGEIFAYIGIFFGIVATIVGIIFSIGWLIFSH